MCTRIDYRRILTRIRALHREYSRQEISAEDFATYTGDLLKEASL